jgi:hypothetical protein
LHGVKEQAAAEVQLLTAAENQAGHEIVAALLSGQPPVLKTEEARSSAAGEPSTAVGR